MAATRVFVRGLPPTISEDDFKHHFAKRYAVTDVKLFAQRRIGYVGFKTAEDTAAAVKYFNRSYLRMSRIGVELADAVSDQLVSGVKLESPPLPKSKIPDTLLLRTALLCSCERTIIR